MERFFSGGDERGSATNAMRVRIVQPKKEVLVRYHESNGHGLGKPCIAPDSPLPTERIRIICS